METQQDEQLSCLNVVRSYTVEPIRNVLCNICFAALQLFFYGIQPFSTDNANAESSSTLSWLLTVLVWLLFTVVVLVTCVSGICSLYSYVVYGTIDGVFPGPEYTAMFLEYVAIAMNNFDLYAWTIFVILLASVAVYYMFFLDNDGSSNDGSRYYYSPWRPRVPKDESGTPLEPGAIGLANLGNSCYMSASLQCLNSVFTLRKLFLDDDCESRINEENMLGSGGRVVRHFRGLLVRLWSDQVTVAAPVKFKEMVGELNDDFGGRDQQDASEFMSWLLDQLHEDLNDARRGNAVPMRMRGVSFDALSDDMRAQRSDAEYCARNRSPIVDMFFGQQSSSLKWYVCYLLCLLPVDIVLVFCTKNCNGIM